MGYPDQALHKAERGLAIAQKASVLIREWHSTKHQVTALKDDFMFRAKRFQSLSRIAGEITGTRWSGPLFFGLKNSH